MKMYAIHREKGHMLHLISPLHTAIPGLVYTPHLWLAQHQTTTYGIIFHYLRKTGSFNGFLFFQQKKTVFKLFYKKNDT
ncbi:MAG: hypothetical protein VR65_06730 [Desulfobulbaceae bacterium BRH_c16a]|nr:MAG: hypothetical protein VR65_06730 [Desulfobulbaceae bacterium BRH_c16a]